MQQSLSSKASSSTLSTRSSAASDCVFNHSDKAAGATPVFDELLDLLIPAIDCVDCPGYSDGCSTCAGSLLEAREALMSFIGSCFSEEASYDVKQGIYTYCINNPSGSAACAGSSGHATGSSSSATICDNDCEFGLAVLNAAIKRIIGSDHCFNTEKKKRPDPYKLITKRDLRLITISGFKSFNYLDSRLIAILTRCLSDGFHGFLWLTGYGKLRFMTPPEDVRMCCDEEDFNERMTAIPVLGVTEGKLISHFHSKLGLTDIDGLEDLVALLTAEAEGIKAKCLAVFKKTHAWLYRDEAVEAALPDETLAYTAEQAAKSEVDELVQILKGDMRL